MSIKETEFTIREVTYYTGRMTIDTDEWERIFGKPFDAENALGYDLSEYEHLNTLGHEHTEHYADVDGQYWFDVGISDAEQEVVGA